MTALGALFLGLLLLPRPNAALSLPIADVAFITEGETTTIRSFYGFNPEPEQSGALRYRWTDGAGNFVVRFGQRYGGPRLLTLTLCGCRADAPARAVTIGADGATLADITQSAAQPGFRTYRLLLPERRPAYAPDTFVEIVSDTVPNATFGYPLGVAVAQAEFGAIGPQRAYDTAAALGLAIMIGLLTQVIERRRGRRAALSWAMITLILVVAQGYFYQPHQLPVWVFAALLVVAVGLGGWGARAADARSGAPLADARSGAGTDARSDVHANAHADAARCVPTLLVVLLPQWLGGWIIDDAFISFRYALNALNGHGLVFNPGERVEGYTNFLWTALFVPVLGLGWPPGTVALALTLLFALLTTALLWRVTTRALGELPALAGALLLASAPPFVLYVARGSGMETALFTLLLLAGIAALAGIYPQITQITQITVPLSVNPAPTHTDRPGAVGSVRPLYLAGALFGLAAMTRPEGVLVAGLSGMALLIAGWRGGRRAALGAALRLGAAFVLVFGPYYLWRFSYYGYPLPNTFYAKVGGSGAQVLRGLAYLAEFGRDHAPLLLLALLGALDGLRRRQRLPGYLTLLVCVYGAYIAAVGGDHFPLYRFFVPLLPPLALLAAYGVAALARFGIAAGTSLRRNEETKDTKAGNGREDGLGARRGQRAFWTTIGSTSLVLLAVAWHIPTLWDSRTLNPASQVWGENSVVEKNREIGLWLRRVGDPQTLTATGIAGALPFYSGQPTLDSLGLNDVYIAHLEVATIGQGVAGSEKTDVNYVLGKRPAYIPYNTAGPFFGNPAFARDYKLGIIRGPEGRYFRIYRRVDVPPPPDWNDVVP